MSDNPVLLVFAGLPGVGKSTAISIVTDLHNNVAVHSSDRIRKELFDNVTYSGEESQETYAELYSRTRESLENGVDTVIDGTMSLQYGRDTAARIAAETNANVVFVKVECDEHIAKQRLRERSMSNDGVSDADEDVYDAFEFEPFTRDHVVITNNGSEKQLRAQIQKHVMSTLWKPGENCVRGDVVECSGESG